MSIRIQGPDVARRVAEFFGVRGKYRPEVEEFIVPTVQVGDLSVPGLPPVSRHASCRINVAPTAGEYSMFGLAALPGLICVITDIDVFSSVANSVVADFRDERAMTPLTAFFTDNRLTLGQRFPAQVPAAVIGANTEVMILAQQAWGATLPASIPRHFSPKGWVIGSGLAGGTGHLHLSLTTVNVGLFGSVEWDEYEVF